MSIPNVLSIAGSDPSGGAGVQADLETFSALGCYGMAVIAGLTAQNTQGVRSVVDVPARFLKDQIDAVFEDITVASVKIGMLGSAENVAVVAECLERWKPAHIVLDPVMVATSGDVLISSEALEALKAQLVPLASVITPNIPEAEKLSRKAVIDMEVAARGLLDLGARAVLLKGGHLKGDVMRDVLAVRGGGVEVYEAARVDTENTHGTGCTLSSAVAARLALGDDLEDACGAAKVYLTEALKRAHILNVGRGCGPVWHFVEVR